MAWPYPEASWEFPDDTPDNRARWQGAIDAALHTGVLTLTKGVEPNVLWLDGSCPRCGHPLRQRVRYNVIKRLATEPIKANIDCSCDAPHKGRDDKDTGCGWGGPIPVELAQP